jgi:DNA-binding NarL/FixJ family response regulator
MDAADDVARGLAPLRVVVVSEVRLVREGLARILSSEPDITVVHAASALQATSEIATSRPHLVIAESAIVRGTDLVVRASEAGAAVVRTEYLKRTKRRSCPARKRAS